MFFIYFTASFVSKFKSLHYKELRVSLTRRKKQIEWYVWNG